jgi:hypothetical protein
MGSTARLAKAFPRGQWRSVNRAIFLASAVVRSTR